MVENAVREGEIACYKQFLLFSQCFLQLSIERQNAVLCGNELNLTEMFVIIHHDEAFVGFSFTTITIISIILYVPGVIPRNIKRSLYCYVWRIITVLGINIPLSNGQEIITLFTCKLVIPDAIHAFISTN